VQPELYSLWKEGGVGTVLGVGRGGGIFRLTPYESWVALSSPTTAPLLSIDGSGPANVWAVGGGGVSVHFDGAQWRRVETGTSEGLIAVKVAAPNDAWAVGTRGTALHFDGAFWRSISTGVASTLRTVDVRGDEVWLGGDAGVILHRQAGVWRREDVPTPASVTSFGMIRDRVFATTNSQVSCDAHLIVRQGMEDSTLVRLSVRVLRVLHIFTAGRFLGLRIVGTVLLAALPLLVLGFLGWGRRRHEAEVRVCLWLLLLSVPGAIAFQWHLSEVMRFGKGITPYPAELTRVQDWVLLEHELSKAVALPSEGPRPRMSAEGHLVPGFIEGADSLTGPRGDELRERYARLISTGSASPFALQPELPASRQPKRTLKNFGQNNAY
jgi:hypothetical protein